MSSAARIPAELAPALDSRAERILSSRVQRFVGHVYRIHYTTALSQGTITISGQPPSLAASSNWHPLALRRNVFLAVGGLLGCGALTASVYYALRHPWFLHYGHSGLVLLLGGLTALAGAVTCASGLLAHQARQPKQLGVAAMAAILLLVATSLAYTRLGPTVRAAQAALEAGDKERARITADGIRQLGIDREAGEAILDALHFDAVRAAQSLDALNQQVRETWNSAQRRAAAVDVLREQALRESEQLYAQRNIPAFEQLSRLVGDLLPEADQQRLGWQGALLRAGSCSPDGNATCVTEQLAKAKEHGAATEAMQLVREQTADVLGQHFAASIKRLNAATTPPEKRSALLDALQQATSFQEFVGSESVPSPAQLTQQLVRVELQIKQAEAKAAAKAAREAAKQQHEVARRERIEQASNRGLRCCDGSTSPSCSCGGSHRGCCSRHGGVCGCE